MSPYFYSWSAAPRRRFGWAVLLFALESPPVQILYPHPHGVIFALPHVSIIFKTHAPQPGRLIQSVKLEVDGRPVPEDAISHCAICAGPNPAVIAARAPWTIRDGAHHLVITATDTQGNTYRSELRYTMDSSVPSLSGLTGSILFPNAGVSSARSLRLGGSSNGAWWGATLRSPLPLEIIGEARQKRDFALSWKANLLHSPRSPLSLSVGQRAGDAFAVLGFHTQPNYFNLSLGVGASDLPSAWLGASYSLSHLTPRLQHSKKLDNFFAVVDLVSLHVETDNQGKVNLGATLSHPYGWRVGLSRVQQSRGGRPCQPAQGLPEPRWQWQVSYSLPLK
jgi:hypothetical protein